MSDTRSAATIVRNDAPEAVVERRADRPPGTHLVFQSFEIDDIGVDGDTYGHDDAGDTSQREREVLRATEIRDEREEDHRR